MGVIDVLLATREFIEGTSTDITVSRARGVSAEFDALWTTTRAAPNFRRDDARNLT